MSTKYSYLTPKAGVHRSSVGGKGVFAKQKIRKGEIVVILGGQIISLKKSRKVKKCIEERVGVAENFYMTGFFLPGPWEESDFLNHSCAPTLGFKGQIVLVALRDVYPGEELTFDYAMAETKDMHLKCKCGSKNCRGIITKDDWKRKALQRKYKGYFSWFIQEKIKQGIKLLRRQKKLCQAFP